MYNKGLQTDFVFLSLYSHKKYSQNPTFFPASTVALPLNIKVLVAYSYKIVVERYLHY